MAIELSREVDESLTWSIQKDISTHPFNLKRIKGNGEVAEVDNRLQARFKGKEGVYQFQLNLEQPFMANGVGARFRLRDWDSIRYVAIGYTFEGVFRHVKIPNAARDSWVDFSIGHQDIAWGLQNNWESPPPAEIKDIRIYLKGTPGDASWLDVESLSCWRESEQSPEWLSEWDAASPVSQDLLEVIYAYLRKCFRNFEQQAAGFIEEGSCPLYGDVALSWALPESCPSDLSKVNTYRFSWHSLHPATILMLQARTSGDLAPLFAAREMITNWLEQSYYRPDEDKKFAWYDHGTAERLISMVLMWAFGLEHRFDHRFMARLRLAIFRHGQLLASELFYASHQPTRYHNHAWFQDLALMATSLAMADFPCAGQWLETGMGRLTDQLEQLVVRDNGYAVFVENSIGYHQGVQRLVEFAGGLVALTGKESVISAVASELPRFSEFLRYPDNRAPAQGDTFRRSNASGGDIRRLKPYPEPSCTILPNAGYAIVKGNHDGCRFMLTMLATSLCRTHKHEDNLSFTLFFDGLEWLIDPSFYSHEYKEPIPAYLRSAAAHNNLFLPGREYSIDPGNAHLEGEADNGDFHLRGTHRAYDGVVVERELRGRVDCLDVRAIDRATWKSWSVRRQDLRLRFHFGEQVEAKVSGATVLLTHPDSQFSLELTLPSERNELHYGQGESNSVCGVTGLGFMQSAPVFTVECNVSPNVDLPWRLKAIRDTGA